MTTHADLAPMLESDGDPSPVLAAYALDALDGGHAQLVEHHLTTCAACRQTVDELQESLVALVEPLAIEPPARLRGNVLAAIAAEVLAPMPAAPEQIPAALVAATTPIVRVESLARVAPRALAVAASSAAVVSLDGKRKARAVALEPRRLLAVAAAACLLAVGGLGYRSASLSNQLSDQQRISAEVAAVIAAPDAHVVRAAVSGGGSASVVVSAKLQRTVFVGHGLQDLPSDHTYQLWYINSAGKATGAGLFRSVVEGSAGVVLAGTPKGATAVGLTVEPAGGSQAPTTKPVMVIKV